MEYIEETGRNFDERYKEHLRVPSPIFDHFQTTGHNTLDNFLIVGRESQGFTRTIKEEMFITVNEATLNRNLGRYQLPHIWDKVLQGMPALHLQWHPPLQPQFHYHTCTTSSTKGGHKYA